jgi:hypothetical protein
MQCCTVTCRQLSLLLLAVPLMEFEITDVFQAARRQKILIR